VQGLLRKSSLEVEIKSTCAHCGEPIELVVDSELNHRVARGGPNPLVFEPDINWAEFKDPTIIDGY
jgi:5-methylcytosine-specific restriction endonuclease McrA